MSAFRTHIIALLIISSLAAFGAAEETHWAKPRNLLIVTVDTLRADYLGCYGNRTVKTPAIDALAAAGVRFDFCVAHAPMTLPSHTSILTGQDPRQHGVRDNIGFRAKSNLMTLAETLKSRGFSTAAFVSAFVLDSRFGLDQGFDHYDDHVGIAPAGALYYTERRADATVDLALNWINSADSSKPWFVWLHLFDPHAPYDPPADYKSRFADSPYAGEISYVDSQLARIFDKVKRSGDTIIVVTSDHGEGLGEHGEESHGVFAYNTTIHVPFIIFAPGSVKAGSVIERRVRHIDIMPTTLEMLGVPTPKTVSGESLVALMAGRDKGEAPDSYFEAMFGYYNRGWAPPQGLYSGDLKFIKLPLAELYDMETDRAEKNNIISRSASTARQMLTSLRELLADEQATERVDEDQATLGKLRDLGYITTSAPATKDQFGPEDDPKRLNPLGKKLDEIKQMDLRSQSKEAISALRTLVREHPTFRAAYEVMIIYLLRLGRGDEAVAAAKEAIAQGVQDFEMIKTLAGTHYTLGQYDKAIPIYEKLLEQDPSDAEISGPLAICLYNTGKPSRAEKLFKQTLEIDPGYAEIRVAYATMLFRNGNGTEALKQLDQVLAIYPDHDPALTTRGMALEVEGKYEEAAAQYRSAIKKNPENFMALYRLILIMVNLQNKLDDAMPLIEQFLETADPRQYGPQISSLRELLKKAGRSK